MISELKGRDSTTGTVIDALAARGATDLKTGAPYSEALALGASGGIAFGYFVFEYTGHLPHVALLTRNTFQPFERTLDNLAIKRESRETTDGAKAEKNLRAELENGNPVIVIADVYSMPHRGLDPEQMWYMGPHLVLGQDGDDFLLADGSSKPIRISAEALAKARSRVKKDRHRMLVLEPPDPAKVAEGLLRGIETAAALFLDKPPAGSANNFGIAGMRFWAKMLVELKNAKSWNRMFEPGPRLTQALAGSHGQPGVWDWIETWGTSGGADRGTYADFLVEAAAWTEIRALAKAGEPFRESAKLWSQLADQTMPDAIPGMKRLKELKRRHNLVYIEQGVDALEERADIRKEMKSLVDLLQDPAKLAPYAEEIRTGMAATISQIAQIEEDAIRNIRSLVHP